MRPSRCPRVVTPGPIHAGGHDESRRAATRYTRAMRRVAMVGLGGVAALLAACSEPVDEELPCGAREIVRDHRSPLCLSAH